MKRGPRCSHVHICVCVYVLFGRRLGLARLADAARAAAIPERLEVGACPRGEQRPGALETGRPLGEALVARGDAALLPLSRPRTLALVSESISAAQQASGARRGAHTHRSQVEASADECAQLAERFGWAKLSWLRATATLTRFDAARRRTRVSGKMWGQLARTGADGGRRVLTVEAEPFESVYIPAGAGDGADAAIDLEADFDDEMGSGGEIDVGECVAQHFYLHVEDGALEELAEWVGSGLEADGTVVYDSTG